MDLIPKGGQLWNKTPRFEDMKKEPLENTAKSIYEENHYGCIKAKKNQYLTAKPHSCDENKVFAPIGIPLATN